MDFTTTLQALFGEMEKFFQTDTVIGQAITIDGITIVPVIDVTFGAGSIAGKHEGPGKRSDQGSASAGGGAGGRIEPKAVIVINNGIVSALSLKGGSAGPLDSLIQYIPEVVDKLKRT